MADTRKDKGAYCSCGTITSLEELITSFFERSKLKVFHYAREEECSLLSLVMQCLQVGNAWTMPVTASRIKAKESWGCQTWCILMTQRYCSYFLFFSNAANWRRTGWQTLNQKSSKAFIIASWRQLRVGLRRSNSVSVGRSMRHLDTARRKSLETGRLIRMKPPEHQRITNK